MWQGNLEKGDVMDQSHTEPACARDLAGASSGSPHSALPPTAQLPPLLISMETAGEKRPIDRMWGQALGCPGHREGRIERCRQPGFESRSATCLASRQAHRPGLTSLVWSTGMTCACCKGLWWECNETRMPSTTPGPTLELN